MAGPGRLTRWWCDTRIALAFRAYDKDCLSAHLEEAERRFPVSIVEREIEDLRASARASADEVFPNPIEQLRARLASLSSSLTAGRRRLEILQRDYRSEIRSIRSSLNARHAKKNKLLREKQAAERERRAAASQIAEWHDSTKDWLGSRRRDIPQYSWFGQSWSELDELKDDYEERVGEIASIGDRLDPVVDDIIGINEKLQWLHAQRLEQEELRSKGFTPASVQRSIDLILSDMQPLKAEKAAQEEQRAARIAELEKDGGLAELVARRDDLATKKSAFVDRFLDPEAIKTRRETHRRQWLEQRGYVDDWKAGPAAPSADAA